MTMEPELHAMSAVLGALQPLDDGARSRVIKWAVEKLEISGGLALGETKGDSSNPDGDGGVPEIAGVSSAATPWLKQNSVNPSDLEAVFHIDGDGVSVIAAEVPGKSTRERVLNCYILAGVCELLRSGQSGFSDKKARTLCESFGCLDVGNHSKYLAEKGNEFAGSKDKGWVLTAPGKKRGAVLVKQMAGTAD